MSDVVLAAVFSSLGAALVAIAGALAAIFGPAWTARSSRKDERESEREAKRFSAALVFTEALMRHAAGYSSASHSGVLIARTEFVATLGEGEGAVARFTAMVTRHVDASVQDEARDNAVTDARLGSDALFAWLRDDIPTSDLDMGEAEFFFHARNRF